MPSTPELTLVLDLSACLSLGLVATGSGTGDRTLAFRIKEQGARGETAHLLLEECLAEAGASIGEIGSICVGVGPGSFTGIRVCAAMAQGLAFAKRLPLYPFSSLAAIAACASTADGAVDAITAIAAIAANAGRYFVRSGGKEALMTLEGLLSLGGMGTSGSTESIGGGKTVLATAGNLPERERLRPAFGALERFEETADFGRIARMARASAPVVDGVLRPNYLMASAAEEKRRSGLEGPPETSA